MSFTGKCQNASFQSTLGRSGARSNDLDTRDQLFLAGIVREGRPDSVILHPVQPGGKQHLLSSSPVPVALLIKPSDTTYPGSITAGIMAAWAG